MEKRTLIALIATRSIPLADGLSALLKALPQIDEVTIARDFDIALQHIEAHKPRILLLDFVLLGNNPVVLLEKVNLLSPYTQRVLLVDDMKEVNLVPHYAEAILIKGIAPSAIAKARLKRQYPPTGKIVDIGGYRLHMHNVDQVSVL